MIHFLIGIIRKLIRFVGTKYYKIFLGSLGNDSYINNPLKLDGRENIYIGNKVIIEYKTWLAAVPLTGASNCKLEIHDGAVIGHFNHIYATKSIIIEKNVLTADKVYISDNLHQYDISNIPIKDQPIIQKGEVVIGEGSWLGENVCILGSKIGKHCVVGSNSVVTKDIPDYCVVVGIPAKIIKRYDFDTQTWRKTNSEGKFID